MGTPNSVSTLLVVGAASTVTLPFANVPTVVVGPAIVPLVLGIVTLVTHRGRREAGNLPAS